MTKRDHTNSIKGFYVARESWYFREEALGSYFDDIMIGMYDPEGGTSGEFSIKWKELDKSYTPQLQVYEDGWSALNECSDLLPELAKLDRPYGSGRPITREDIKQLLLSLGYCDLTKRNYADSYPEGE